MNRQKLRAEMVDIISDNLEMDDVMDCINPSSVVRCVDLILDLQDKYKKEEEKGNLKFEEFWKLVPKKRKVGKPQAKRQWDKLSQKNQQLALDKAQIYYDRIDEEIQFTLHPERYLSKRAFDAVEEVIPVGITYYQWQELAKMMSPEARERDFRSYRVENGLYYKI